MPPAFLNVAHNDSAPDPLADRDGLAPAAAIALAPTIMTLAPTMVAAPVIAMSAFTHVHMHARCIKLDAFRERGRCQRDPGRGGNSNQQLHLSLLWMG
jgi:hypothetical protein